MCFSAPRRTSKGMRIRPEGTGPANWTSSCPWWGTQWGWAMSGGFPTWPSRTGEVWLFRSFRCGRAGTCGLAGDPQQGMQNLGTWAERGGSGQALHTPAPSRVGIRGKAESRSYHTWLALDSGGRFNLQIELRGEMGSHRPHCPLGRPPTWEVLIQGNTYAGEFKS